MLFASVGDIKGFAMEFLLREDSRYCQHTALNYLDKLYGFELIVRDVLPRCEKNELLQSIANLVPCAFRSSMLDEKLYEAYQQTGDSYYQGDADTEKQSVGIGRVLSGC